MKYIILLILLAGCTSIDHYYPNDQGVNEALKLCKKKANDKFYAENSPLGGLDAGIAGVLGGAIGGALVGAATAASTPNTVMKASDINPYVENCMKEKGYEGSSVSSTI